MTQLDASLVKRVLESAPEGVVVCDASEQDHPVIFANEAFAQMTGYAVAELLGMNLRLLQGSDRDQEGVRRMHDAIAQGEPCRVLVRNYRKNGELLWNEITLQPLRDGKGVLTHFVAFHRDAAGRLRQPEKAGEGLPGWVREDRVTGLATRAWFNELLEREWRIARRAGTPLTLVLFDVDALASYNATFGRPAGDACLRRIAGNIAGVFRRGTDIVGLWREGCVAVLAVHRDDSAVPGMAGHARATVQRVADMHIHHPRAPLQKFVTITAALVTVTPGRSEEGAARLVRQADETLQRAKQETPGDLCQSGD